MDGEWEGETWLQLFGQVPADFKSWPRKFGQ